MIKPIFTSGTARGGTNLRAQILSVNKEVSVASDPYIPLFRELCKAIFRQYSDSEVIAASSQNPNLDDYYFSPTKLRMMKYIQQANLDIPFDQENWPKLRESMVRRMSLASANLIPYIDTLPAPTFQEVFQNALKVVKVARHADNCKWVGFNDNWAVEFFSILARAFPDAKFMIFLRDPRGAIDSALHTETDPLKIPHVISFAKHWRKYVAFMLEFSNNPLFNDRLIVSTYESLLLNPEKYVKEMTEFLGVEFDPSMFNPDNFRTATGGKWQTSWEIYQSSIDLWESRLPDHIIETIEFICDPDMRLLGYSPLKYSGSNLSKEAIEFILKDLKECKGWRTDFRQVEMDLGFELFRKALLSNKDKQIDEEVIERCFLFKNVYNNLIS